MKTILPATLPWTMTDPTTDTDRQSNTFLIRGAPYRWRKHGREKADQVAAITFGGGMSPAGPWHYPQDIATANAHLLFAAPDLSHALQLHVAFLNSLGNGWLGRTSGDVGLLNDAYLATRVALTKARLPLDLLRA